MPYTPLRHKPKRPVAKILAVILIIVLLLFTLPLPFSFSTTLSATGLGPARAQISSKDCLWLSGTWSSQGGGTSVTLEIIGADGTVAYNDTLGFGTFSFYAPDAPYTAVVFSSVATTVRISGTAWGPLIPIGLP